MGERDLSAVPLRQPTPQERAQRSAELFLASYGRFNTNGDRVISRAELLAGLRSHLGDQVRELSAMDREQPGVLKGRLDWPAVSHLRGLAENPNVQLQYARSHSLEQHARVTGTTVEALGAELRRQGIDRIEQLTQEDVAGLGREFLPTVVALNEGTRVADRGGRGGRGE